MSSRTDFIAIVASTLLLHSRKERGEHAGDGVCIKHGSGNPPLQTLLNVMQGLRVGQDPRSSCMWSTLVGVQFKGCVPFTKRSSKPTEQTWKLMHCCQQYDQCQQHWQDGELHYYHSTTSTTLLHTSPTRATHTSPHAGTCYIR